MSLDSISVQTREKKGFSISTDKLKLDISFIHNWLSKKSYWCPGIPMHLVKRAIENSLCFGVYNPEGKQVGFGRVITDFTTFAWVTDVFIIKKYRGQGLSRFLMDCALNHPDLKTIRRWLLGTSYAHGLYKKLGFEPLDEPDNFLTIHISNMYQKKN